MVTGGKPSLHTHYVTDGGCPVASLQTFQLGLSGIRRFTALHAWRNGSCSRQPPSESNVDCDLLGAGVRPCYPAHYALFVELKRSSRLLSWAGKGLYRPSLTCQTGGFSTNFWGQAPAQCAGFLFASAGSTNPWSHQRMPRLAFGTCCR